MKKVAAITIMFLLVTVVWTVHAESIVFTESGQILDGEIWDFVEIYNDDTVVDMSGGFADYITTYNASTLNVMGGHADFGAVDYSTINISGGTFTGAQAHDYATINFSDNGSGNYLEADVFGTVNFTGGFLERVLVSGDGVANLFYGDISNYISARDSSVINIFGSDLFKEDTGGSYGYGHAWGIWTDNSAFNIDFGNPETYSHVNLVPEPSTLSLLGLGILVLRKKK